MDKKASIFTITMGTIYPLIIIFGIYVIINGHKSPGGGFQGGAILASAFIIHYLTSDVRNVNLNLFNKVEKALYFCVIVFSIIFVLNLNNSLPLIVKEYYLIIMNILIGIKVFCGLSVVFFRFVLFESR